MNRLTNGITRRVIYNNPIAKQLFDKLHKLEDIEQELGVDLATLFEALKNGFWVKEQNKDNDIIHVRARLNVEEQTLDFFEPNMETIGIGRNIFQYGQTWALKKEELLWNL